MELRRVNPTLIPRCIASPVSGTSITATSSRRSVTPRPPATGVTRRACSPTTTSTLILDGRMAAVRELLGAFPPQAPITDAELALASATADAADGLYDESAAHIALAEQPCLHAARRSAPAGRARACRDQALAGSTPWRYRGRVGGLPLDRGGADVAAPARGDAPQPPSGHRAGQSRHREGVVAALGRGPPPSRAGARARAPDRAAVPGDGVPRPPRARRPHDGGLPVSAARRLAEQAVSIAEAHGWDTDHEVAAAFAVAGLTLVWLGRFANGRASGSTVRNRRWPAAGLPQPRCCSTRARALLLPRAGPGRRRDGGLPRGGGRLRELLPDEHPFSARSARSRPAGAAPGRGDRGRATPRSRDMAPAERRRPRCASPAAALELAEGRAERALEELGPVIERRGAHHLSPGRRPSRRCCSRPRRTSELGDAASRRGLARARARARRAGRDRPAVRAHRRSGSCSSATAATARPTPRCWPRSSTCSAAGARQPDGASLCASRSAMPSCASCGTCRATSRRRRSRPSCASPRTRSAPTCATSTPSSTPTAAARRSPGPARLGLLAPAGLSAR